ncbi:MAG: hypothetical protein KME07_08275 [Pegethrix bostrychoides GSE-TBD4-15B]|jgi:hypothetical protein|uniref:Uncharacterized protein n=1 Tax=Pegethrix bostrychoides GSE-TBD4-15B TaxID=2839662 RepID=A0A951U5E9_9CYAN|nr:hypothetical protein [Pegethrix bostrychoides GSE-TBD4-15B]
MPYEQSLRRWVVVRLSPDLRHIDVARFYKYSDALGYQQILRRIDPSRRYEIMFEAKMPR